MSGAGYPWEDNDGYTLTYMIVCVGGGGGVREGERGIEDETTSSFAMEGKGDWGAGRN